MGLGLILHFCSVFPLIWLLKIGMTQVWIFLDFCELCKNGCLDFLFASLESFKFWAFPFLWERRVRVYVHILYCSNERCCVGFWYDLGFVWFLNLGFLVDLIKLDWLLDKLALDVQCDGIEFGNDNWILNWNLLWRSWQLWCKFQNLPCISEDRLKGN